MIDLSLGHIRLQLERETRPVWPDAAYGDPGGRSDLREILANRHHVSAASVAITTGSSMGITAALASRRPPVVLLPKPYYPAFPRITGLLGLDHLFYEALDERGRANSRAAAHLIGHNPGCSIVWNYPHNPTGSVDDAAGRSEVLMATQKAGAELIDDLVYSDLVYTDHYAVDGEPTCAEVRIYSLSKAHALAGERIGYIIASEGRRHEIERAHWALAMSPPATSQVLAYDAVRSHPFGNERLREQLRTLRDRACAQLSQHPELVVLAPAGGIFVWIEIPELNIGGDVLAELCRRAGLLLASGAVFGVTDRTAIRMSFAVEPDVLDRGLNLFLTIVDRVLARTGAPSEE